MANKEEQLKTVVPYKNKKAHKKKQLEEMFDRIAPVYDKANHLFSLNIDKGWRKKAIRELGQVQPNILLDVATGTGDFAFEAAQQLLPEKIVGIDISEGMMDLGRQKAGKKKLEKVVSFQWGDVENLEFERNSFDGTSVAFGVRNFTDLPKGLSEMCRVLKPGGKAVILELSMPKNPVISFFYKFYFQKLMPLVGGWLSKDKEAYGYLNRSVAAFPEREEFIGLMKEAGFKKAKWRSLTFGICMLYVGEK